MPRLRILSSKEVIKALNTYGFEVVNQRGSHVKLVRKAPTGRQVITIPENKELPVGTLKAIYNQISRFVSQDELHKDFFIED
jgi:predicted RNA binding protein YcfA (HicA-like mRNA interferase family)